MVRAGDMRHRIPERHREKENGPGAAAIGSGHEFR
jgi:hypothetical protein